MLRSNPIDPDPRVEKEALALIRNGISVFILCWNRLISCGSWSLVQSDNSLRGSLKFPYNPIIMIVCITSKTITSPAQMYFVKLFMFLKYYLQKYKKYHCFTFYWRRMSVNNQSL